MPKTKTQKPKIKVVTNRDKELFKQLSRTGIITREQAVSHLGYDNNFKRLSNLAKDGYLKEEYTKVGKEFMTVYRLNDTGKDYVKHNIAEVDKLYKFASVNHDYTLTEAYYSEAFYEYRDTWRTETDYKQINSFGAPDATVTIGDRTVVIEVVTSSYNEAQIQEKYDFAELHGMEVHQIDIK